MGVSSMSVESRLAISSKLDYLSALPREREASARRLEASNAPAHCHKRAHANQAAALAFAD
jgi:hypothetical protein